MIHYQSVKGKKKEEVGALVFGAGERAQVLSHEFVSKKAVKRQGVQELTEKTAGKDQG